MGRIPTQLLVLFVPEHLLLLTGLKCCVILLVLIFHAFNYFASQSVGQFSRKAMGHVHIPSHTVPYTDYVTWTFSQQVRWRIIERNAEYLHERAIIGCLWCIHTVRHRKRQQKDTDRHQSLAQSPKWMCCVSVQYGRFHKIPCNLFFISVNKPLDTFLFNIHLRVPFEKRICNKILLKVIFLV